MFEKIYIISFLLIYFIVVLVVPSIKVKRNTGINPYVFKNTDSVQDYIGKTFTIINIAIFCMSLVNLFSLAGYQYLLPVKWLEISILKYIGLVFIHFALLWIVTAQVQMSSSWRVGIDHSAKTDLKTNGLFSVSRNPVFLGMLITLAGIFLILPNAITLLTAVTSTLLFQVQVRLEEEYLKKTHGEAYTVYIQKVARWI